MDVTISATAVITCAKPGCGSPAALAESVYVDGCGQVCAGCAGPLPEWWDKIEAPF